MKLPAAQSDSPFTTEQLAAVTTRGVSVALSAGAGCGKTYVLTERYLAHFSPDDPDALRPDQLGQLVAITFTERAAREMRDRIRAKCYERLLVADEAHVPYWSALLRSLDAARISTIHSFCASLLRTRAIEARLDPDFSVLEQAQADTLLAEVSEDEVRRLIAEQDFAAMSLAERFDVYALDEMLRQMVRLCPADQFAVWRDVSPVEQVSRWQGFHLKHVLPAIGRDVGRSPEAREVLSILQEDTPTNSTMQSRRGVLLDVLPSLADGPLDFQRLTAALDAIHGAARVQGGGSAGSWATPEVYDRYKKAAERLRKLVAAAKEAAGFNPAAALEAATLGNQLLRIAEGVRSQYDLRKAELNVLDFNDLLARARALLTDPAHAEMRARLASQMRLLLVDEFQDTDPQQVELVEALCGEGLEAGKLFFVGDYKQSIYRFRGAMPLVFRRLRERTPADGQLSLTWNFRSQPAILEFVNALFWDDLGEGYEPLRAKRPQASPTPAVEFLWAPAPPGTRESKDALREREADWIARRIRQFVDEGAPIVYEPQGAGDGLRPPRLADIAILFRALSDVELYERALRNCGIDYYVVGGHAFYAQQEIFDLLNLLRAVNSSADLVSLVGVLRSGFFSLADETIFWLAQHSQGLAGGLFAADYPPAISPSEQARVQLAAETIRTLRARKDRLRIGELLELALDCTGYDAILLNEFMGERKLANLRKLVEQARSFQRGDLFDLADFITQLSEFVARQPDEALAATHSEDTDVVRLMTIHQSKGLEFPIVFVPDLDRPRHTRSSGVHFSTELGPLVRLRETSDGAVALSGYELWRLAEKAEDSAELNRLLYVATTRAADYLVLSAGVPQAGAASGPWTQLLAGRFDLLSGAMTGRLPEKETRPQVGVTLERPKLDGSVAGREKRVDLAKILRDVEQAPATLGRRRSAIDPVLPHLAARAQYSFSRLAGTVHAERPVLDERESAPSNDALDLGTLVHSVIAAIDFARPSEVGELVNIHAERHGLFDARALSEARAMVERFIGSPRARELAAAAESLAEVEFLLAWPPEAGDRPTTLISGYLDRLYRDTTGAWHVIDFKTNRLPAEGTAKLAAHYEMQMLLYGLATEQILKVPPASLTLYFLRDGSEYAFPWDAGARDKVVRLIDEGIVAAQQSDSRTYRPPSAPL